MSIARNLHGPPLPQTFPPPPTPHPICDTSLYTQTMSRAEYFWKTNSWTCSSMASTSKHKFEMAETCFCNSLVVAGARQNSRGAPFVHSVFGAFFSTVFFFFISRGGP